MKTVEDRFWEKVDKSGDCWEWTASRKESGYGQLNVGRKPLRAHRVSFQIHFGYMPAVVRHTCDNPPCVNPAHLIAGSQLENIHDAIERGRAHKPPVHSGEANPQSKLTDARVVEARALHAGGMSLRSIAKKYQVDRKTVTQAIRGERWSHVEA